MWQYDIIYVSSQCVYSLVTILLGIVIVSDQWFVVTKHHSNWPAFPMVLKQHTKR